MPLKLSFFFLLEAFHDDTALAFAKGVLRITHKETPLYHNPSILCFRQDHPPRS